MSDTATASAPAAAVDTTKDTAAAQPAAVQPASDAKPAAAAATDAKPAADAKAAPAAAKPATSIISDAGKAQPNADGSKPADAGDGTKDADKDGKKDDAAKSVVPEKYEVKLPDGMTLNAAELEKFTPIAKELGLSNEHMQKLVDYRVQEMTAQAQSQQQAFDNFKQGNYDETVKYFGTKLEAELPFVAKGRDQFADAEAMELLEAAGIGSHKAIVRMFAKMGRTVSEDKLVDGKADVGATPKTPGQVIYGKDK